MLSRVPVVSLSFAALLSAGSASALELQLPPPGEDVVGQVQVIKAKYEDTFADLGEQYNLGYSEMVAANPGVDPWLPGVGTEVIIPTRFVPPRPRTRPGIRRPRSAPSTPPMAIRCRPWCRRARTIRWDRTS